LIVLTQHTSFTFTLNSTLKNMPVFTTITEYINNCLGPDSFTKAVRQLRQDGVGFGEEDINGFNEIHDPLLKEILRGLFGTDTSIVDEICVGHPGNSDYSFLSVQMYGNKWPFLSINGKRVFLGTFKNGEVIFTPFKDADVTYNSSFILQQFGAKKIKYLLLAIRKEDLTQEVRNMMISYGLVHTDVSLPHSGYPTFDFASLEQEIMQDQDQDQHEENSDAESVHCDENCDMTAAIEQGAAAGSDACSDADDLSVPHEFDGKPSTALIEDTDVNDMVAASAEPKIQHESKLESKIQPESKTELKLESKTESKTEPKIQPKSNQPSILGVTLNDGALVVVWDFPGAEKMFTKTGLAPSDGKMVPYLVPN